MSDSKLAAPSLLPNRKRALESFPHTAKHAPQTWASYNPGRMKTMSELLSLTFSIASHIKMWCHRMWSQKRLQGVHVLIQKHSKLNGARGGPLLHSAFDMGNDETINGCLKSEKEAPTFRGDRNESPRRQLFPLWALGGVSQPSAVPSATWFP